MVRFSETLPFLDAEFMVGFYQQFYACIMYELNPQSHPPGPGVYGVVPGDWSSLRDDS